MQLISRIARFRTGLFLALTTATFLLQVSTGPLPLLNASLGAQNILAFESPLAAKEAQAQITAVLDQMDKTGYELEPETLGFTFRAVNRFKSPFSYDIYGGSISRKINKTVIRLEGGAGDVQMFTRILEQKNIITTNRTPPDDVQPRALNRKSQWALQGVNFLAPWAGVIYGAWDSPRLTRGQTFWRALGFMLLDFLAVYGSGSNWFREPFDAGKWNNSIIGGLLVTRALGAWQNGDLIRGHNRVAELKFTFYLK